MNIVFILTSSVNQNAIKRIDEFCERGYNVKAYGFDCDVSYSNKSKYIDVEIVGSYSLSLPYRKRIGIIRQGIKTVLSQNPEKDCIFYLVGYDIGLLYTFTSKRPYIYEEPDLVHTYISNSFARKVLERIDKYIILHSIISVFRSEGFPVFHFGNKIPANCAVIANRLNKDLINIPVSKKKEVDFNHLKIGFAGVIRFKSVRNFAEVFCRSFPECEFHFHGNLNDKKNVELFEPLQSLKNCYFHGSYKNPNDLPAIYSSVDLMLSTYDVEFENVRYAEPNKIYEAIYFETPIIVSSGTFLAEKVNRLGIGYDVDAMNEKEVVDFVKNLTNESIEKKRQAAKAIDKSETLNINDGFFEFLEEKLAELK